MEKNIILYANNKWYNLNINKNASQDTQWLECNLLHEHSKTLAHSNLNVKQ